MKKDSAVTRNSYSEKALLYLREQIINGNLHPQEKLIESDIAQALGISRGPVRDALKQLAVEGLVDYQPNKGCTVALISPRDAYEVFFLRGNLEKLALEKSGCHIGDYGIFVMETALDEMRAVSGTENTMAEVNADEKFHRQIVLASQMDRKDVGAAQSFERRHVPFPQKRQQLSSCQGFGSYTPQRSGNFS